MGIIDIKGVYIYICQQCLTIPAVRGAAYTLSHMMDTTLYIQLYQLFSAPRVLNHPPGHLSGPYHGIAVPQSIGDVLVTCNLSGSKHLGLSDSYIQAHGDAET